MVAEGVDRGLERLAQPAALGGEDGEPDPALCRSSAPNSGRARCARRSPGPHGRPRAHRAVRPRAAASRPRARARARRWPARRARSARTASPIASQPSVVGSSRGSSGASASAAASAAARPGRSVPDLALRAEARARSAGPPGRDRGHLNASRSGHQERPGRRRQRRPGADADADHELHRDQPGPHGPRRAGSRIPYVPSAARAEAPPTSFNPAAATSTSPRTRQTTTETIDGREGNSIRARPDASSAPSRPQETLRSRSSAASTAPGARRTAPSSGSSPCATRTARPSC